jgi:hypothetical protein
MMRPSLWSLLLLLAANQACSGDCLSYSGGAIIVDIVDARSGAAIATGATLVARGSGGADSLYVPDDGQVRGSLTLFDAFIHAGMYTVEVRRTGYRTWTRENVLVRARDGCGHVRAVHLTAELQAL